MIEPGFDQMSEKQRGGIVQEINDTVAAIGATHGNGAWKSKLLIKDRIADSIFQQILIRPDEYEVVATPNLNGDYFSDAAAAQVGGLGMAPGANIGDKAAVFEATHGTAPKYADKDVINPSSVILSGVMMFDHMGWREVERVDHRRPDEDDSAEARDLRSGAPDGRRDEAQDQRVRLGHHREHVAQRGLGIEVR